MKALGKTLSIYLNSGYNELNVLNTRYNELIVRNETGYSYFYAFYDQNYAFLIKKIPQKRIFRVFVLATW